MSTKTESNHQPNGNGFMEMDDAEHHFASQFGHLESPEAVRNSYQRVMHQHTKQQFEMATASSRRRSTNGSIGTASLSTQSSIDSTSSPTS